MMNNNLIHFHGFKCENIRMKPATFDNDNEIKFPNEARRNHLNYFASIIVDITQFTVSDKMNIFFGGSHQIISNVSMMNPLTGGITNGANYMSGRSVITWIKW